jgi:hypothetical protein
MKLVSFITLALTSLALASPVVDNALEKGKIQLLFLLSVLFFIS